jgi:hypothetical protein
VITTVVIVVTFSNITVIPPISRACCISSIHYFLTTSFFFYFAVTDSQVSSETLFYIEFNKSDTGASASASTKQRTLLINHSLLLPPVTAEVQYESNAFFNIHINCYIVMLCYVS